MEKLSFVKNGVLTLPPGFRFHPTDEELVVHYLNRKVHSSPLPSSINIPQVDLCISDPWDLPGDREQERFFFSRNELKYPNGHRSNRGTQSGYWKATGLDKRIVGSGTNWQVVGMKKTLVFYKGKSPNGSRTNWVMHEYRLLPRTQSQMLENWVLCRIFLKKRGKKKKKKEEEEEVKPVFYDFLAAPEAKKKNADLDLGPAVVSSSSSGSCGITDADAAST